ncbi:hypothetical protein Fot_28159 [Forsythia ovata]|uniref:Uncharacterized protein n=1 Tax=Forsythia ovata TaxID=205694 RepID=A0ABD1TNR1_9LAMI
MSGSLDKKDVPAARQLDEELKRSVTEASMDCSRIKEAEVPKFKIRSGVVAEKEEISSQPPIPRTTSVLEVAILLMPEETRVKELAVNYTSSMPSYTINAFINSLLFTKK